MALNRVNNVAGKIYSRQDPYTHLNTNADENTSYYKAYTGPGHLMADCYSYTALASTLYDNKANKLFIGPRVYGTDL